jgi:hypothetical protein
MAPDRLPANDPRTVARDIPGIFDALFPQLAPGVVAYFNRKSCPVADCEPVPVKLVAASNLHRAMLFEVSVAAGEQLLAGDDPVDWDICLKVAVGRQRRHFDAKLPDTLSTADKTVARWVASNLVVMLNQIQTETGAGPVVCSPNIPGYQWIASGVGDFSVGTHLIEVKCTNKHFSSSDYRQIVMYWLLTYASSVENGAPEWSDGILVNPRLNHIVKLPFDEIISVIGAGRSKVDLLELLSSMIGDPTLKMGA